MSNTHPHIVDLGVEPSIRTVAELRDQLITALSQNETVVVSGETVASIDISVLQVLAAAHRSATSSRKSISLRANDALVHALRRAGFVSSSGEPLTREGAFWISTPAAKDEAA